MKGGARIIEERHVKLKERSESYIFMDVPVDFMSIEYGDSNH
jgi:hypothetical protein